jgi:hypothetical protein
MASIFAESSCMAMSNAGEKSAAVIFANGGT